VAIVGFGSAKVPVYRCASGGRIRFAISYHRDGKRMRQFFGDLAAAKKEALLVAQRIQSGMQHMTDLKPHDRESYLAARARLESPGIPLVVAVEDYVQCRDLLKGTPLRLAVEDFIRRTHRVKLGVMVPVVVDELLEAKRRDGMSERYIGQLRSSLGLFARAFPGPIMDVQPEEIDAWLRGGDLAPVTRNNRLTVLRVLFGFAKQRNYLPETESTAAERMSKVKVRNDDVEIFTPAELRRLLHTAPPHLIPILAIGAFSGIRMAELNRLDWSAVDLERGHIELRASQAKTASRRIIPITANLRAWIEPLPRTGKVVRTALLHREVTALARALKLEWPRNVLRHSFISYRIATVKSVDQVALEAGNSAAIIFKHYRELAIEADADKWFGILPKDGQWDNTFDWDRRARVVTLPDNDG
jgi:integrase